MDFDTKGESDASGRAALKEVENIIETFSFSEIVDEENIKDISSYHRAMQRQQAKRARHVTELLQNYKNQQIERNTYKEKAKPKIMRFLMGLIVILTLALGAMVVCYFIFDTNGDMLGGLITSCVTYLGSLLTILLVIVKYIFPENEESNFNDLVKSIISNDTERVKSENKNNGYQEKKSKKR